MADKNYITFFLVSQPVSGGSIEIFCMYLQGALTSLYGESLPLLPEKLYDFISDVSGEQSTQIFSDCIEWQINGDTKIWLFMVDSKEIHLMYISDSFDLSQIGVYDTTGL